MEKVCANSFRNKREKIDFLKKLDGRGIFMSPNETFDSFCERVNALNCENAKILEELSQNSDLTSPIPESDKTDAFDILEKTYRIRPDWVAAFYSAGDVGMFSAGVQFEINGVFPVVFLHSSFAKHASRFLYNSGETLAHELTHAARLPIADSPFEEFLACRVHVSKFRKIAGNFFGRKLNAVASVALVLLSEALFLFGLQNVCPVPLVCLCAVIAYETHLVSVISKAGNLLEKSGYDAFPLLLRLTGGEIFSVAKNGVSGFEKAQPNSLRVEMLVEKFKIRRGF